MISGLASAFYENWISVEKVKKVQFGKRKSEKCILGNAGLQTSWMILGAKFRSWANFPWFFQKRDSLF